MESFPGLRGYRVFKCFADRFGVQHSDSAGGHLLRTFAYAIAVVAMDHYLIVQRAFARVPICIKFASGAAENRL